MGIKNVNKYGIKLEDYSDYNSYKKACNNARTAVYLKTEKGKLSMSRYSKTEKFKLSIAKYQSSINGLKAKAKYLSSINGLKVKAKYQSSVNGRKVRNKYRSSIKGLKLRNAAQAKRRAAKLQRTPAWADLKAIKQFYLNCPKGYQVDHIVPLQGVNVSGFHVLNNLQYLTGSENSSKGNRYAL